MTSWLRKNLIMKFIAMSCGLYRSAVQLNMHCTVAMTTSSVSKTLFLHRIKLTIMEVAMVLNRFHYK